MSLLSYYLLLALLLAVLLAMARLSRQASSLCLVLVWLVLTLFSGLRVGLGRDYIVYLNAYTDPASASATYLDPAWQGLNFVCRDILGLPFHLWLTLVAGATYALLFYGLRRWRVDWVWGVVAFVLIHRGYFESMNAVRQSLAMACILVASSYLVERRTISFLLWTALATLAHTTAITCLVLLPITLYPWRPWVHLVALGASLLVGMLALDRLLTWAVPLLPDRYSLYLEGELLMTTAHTGAFMYFLVALALVLVFYLQTAHRLAPRVWMLVQMTLVSIYIYCTLSSFSPGLRLMLYPFVAIFVLASYFMSEGPMRIRVLTCALLVLFAGFTIKDLANPKEPYAYYQTIFDEPIPRDDPSPHTPVTHDSFPR